jgi:hypothetical protein
VPRVKLTSCDSYLPRTLSSSHRLPSAAASSFSQFLNMWLDLKSPIPLVAELQADAVDRADVGLCDVPSLHKPPERLRGRDGRLSRKLAWRVIRRSRAGDRASRTHRRMVRHRSAIVGITLNISAAHQKGDSPGSTLNLETRGPLPRQGSL